jgi:hypothetical protein
VACSCDAPFGFEDANGLLEWRRVQQRLDEAIDGCWFDARSQPRDQLACVVGSQLRSYRAKHRLDVSARRVVEDVQRIMDREARHLAAERGEPDGRKAGRGGAFLVAELALGGKGVGRLGYHRRPRCRLVPVAAASGSQNQAQGKQLPNRGVVGAGLGQALEEAPEPLAVRLGIAAAIGQVDDEVAGGVVGLVVLQLGRKVLRIGGGEPGQARQPERVIDHVLAEERGAGVQVLLPALGIGSG